MIDKLNDQVSVCDWVSTYPSCAAVFEKFKIDYCCAGTLPLKKTCQEKGLDPSIVEAALRQSFKNITEESINWADLSLEQIIDHIVTVHHKYLLEELPSLSLLIEKVSSKHGKKIPELIEIKDIFSDLSNEIIPHMKKEEATVFPMILQIEKGSDKRKSLSTSLKQFIVELEQEHFVVGKILSKMRTLTKDYSVSEVGCTSHKVLISRLHALESDTFRHIHKENHILFPRALRKK